MRFADFNIFCSIPDSNDEFTVKSVLSRITVQWKCKGNTVSRRCGSRIIDSAVEIVLVRLKLYQIKDTIRSPHIRIDICLNCYAVLIRTYQAGLDRRLHSGGIYIRQRNKSSSTA